MEHHSGSALSIPIGSPLLFMGCSVNGGLELCKQEPVVGVPTVPTAFIEISLQRGRWSRGSGEGRSNPVALTKRAHHIEGKAVKVPELEVKSPV